MSIALSFVFVITFAFCLKWFPAIENYIFIGTMLIKIIAVALGAMVAINGESKGLIKGFLFGLVYISFAFFIFSFLAGGFCFDKNTILDFVICAITGSIIGIIKVNK